jgi:hypothetical protein
MDERTAGYTIYCSIKTARLLNHQRQLRTEGCRPRSSSEIDLRHLIHNHSAFVSNNLTIIVTPRSIESLTAEIFLCLSIKCCC